MKKLILFTLLLFSYSCFTQRRYITVVKEPSYCLELPKPKNLDTFYCKIYKCFYPLASNLSTDSTLNNYNIVFDLTVQKEGNALNFQPQFPYPKELYDSFEKISNIFYNETLLTPARLKNKKGFSTLKVRFNLLISKTKIESFSINSYSNPRQRDFYEMKSKFCN